MYGETVDHGVFAALNGGGASRKESRKKTDCRILRDCRFVELYIFSCIALLLLLLFAELYHSDTRMQREQPCNQVQCFQFHL